MATRNLHETLPTGYRLLDTYEIGAPLHVGVASVRYAATAGDAPVIVEEYFPVHLAVRHDGVEVAPATGGLRDDFNTGLAAFLATARTLARVRDPGIVPVTQWTGANGTGYIVTEDADGDTLDLHLADDSTLSDDELKHMMRPILGGLATVHEAGILHRRINPEAIIVRPDGTPMLRGFGVGAKAVGGARQVFDARTTTLADISPGYTALEQYSVAGREGPWTDIYALGAVLYRCIAGTAPADAPFRAVRAEELPPATLFADSRDARMLGAIDAALAVRIASRPQSLPVWQAMLFGDAQRTLLASRAGRTSARGFGRSTAPAIPVDQPQDGAQRPANAVASESLASRLLRWTMPALAATAAVAVMTWIDTGVLRGGADDPPAALAAGMEFSDPLRSGGVGPTMVVVPPGSVRLGCFPADCSDPGSPGRETAFERPFALAKYEVTQVEYARFVAGGSPQPSGVGVLSRPVVDVSWDDARAYADWLSAETGRDYRLPTEAEWEYIARAGAEVSEGIPEPTPGADLGGAAPVGLGPANAWGFHDLHGNVSEWVSDCTAGSGTDTDGTAQTAADCASRIRRGGWWGDPGAARRAPGEAERRTEDTGFRVAAGLD